VLGAFLTGWLAHDLLPPATPSADPNYHSHTFTELGTIEEARKSSLLLEPDWPLYIDQIPISYWLIQLVAGRPECRLLAAAYVRNIADGLATYRNYGRELRSYEYSDESRRAAVRGQTNVRTCMIVPYLLLALSDRDVAVRNKAILALQDIGSHAAWGLQWVAQLADSTRIGREALDCAWASWQMCGDVNIVAPMLCRAITLGDDSCKTVAARDLAILVVDLGGKHVSWNPAVRDTVARQLRERLQNCDAFDHDKLSAALGQLARSK
jgi:hypothetical protein